MGTGPVLPDDRPTPAARAAPPVEPPALAAALTLAAALLCLRRAVRLALLTLAAALLRLRRAVRLALLTLAAALLRLRRTVRLPLLTLAAALLRLRRSRRARVDLQIRAAAAGDDRRWFQRLGGCQPEGEDRGEESCRHGRHSLPR
jgi:hypothetical protein